MKTVAAVLFLIGLSLCAQNVLAQSTSQLSWQPPTERVDGTPFAVEDIQEYRVTYTITGK